MAERSGTTTTTTTGGGGEAAFEERLRGGNPKRTAALRVPGEFANGRRRLAAKSVTKEKKFSSVFCHGAFLLCRISSFFFVSHTCSLFLPIPDIFSPVKRVAYKFPPQGDISLPSASRWRQLELNPAGLCEG